MIKTKFLSMKYKTHFELALKSSLPSHCTTPSSDSTMNSLWFLEQALLSYLQALTHGDTTARNTLLFCPPPFPYWDDSHLPFQALISYHFLWENFPILLISAVSAGSTRYMLPYFRTCIIFFLECSKENYKTIHT